METRRGFIGLAAGTALGAAVSAEAQMAGEGVARPVIDHTAAKPRNRRPYTGIDWGTAQLVNTTSHGHCLNQRMLDAYLKHNFGLITISNYYPSAPTMPGKTFRRDHYRVHHDHAVMVKGVRTAGPFDWNAIIAPQADKLDEKFRKQLPFKEGGLMFEKWPEGLLEAPNGEHHGFLDAKGRSLGNVHMCAPGSAFKSGTFDAHNSFGTMGRGYHFGSGEFWQVAVDRMIDGLICPDGGGVTINHPRWTHLDRGLLLEMLDYDPRILGIEVLEAGVNSENYWDWALATGRQCYGFFVPDWGYKNDAAFGVNVLVVPERTVHACLKAYRQGDFYGAAHGLGELRFTRIAYDGATVVAETDKPAHFEVKTARGVRKTADGTRVEWTKPNIPKNKRETGSDIFARVKAYAADGCGETLFSQAFML